MATIKDVKKQLKKAQSLLDEIDFFQELNEKAMVESTNSPVYDDTLDEKFEDFKGV